MVVVNLTPTRLDHVADVVLAGSGGKRCWPGLVERVEARCGSLSDPEPAGQPGWSRG